MQYGFALPLSGVDGDFEQVIEWAEQAEQAGWDGVFLEDYIVFWDERPVFDPWLALTAIAMRTERIRLGIGITPLPRRRPWKLAREAVTLDHLSKGRLILGFAIGDNRDRSFTHFGESTDVNERAAMLDEALEILEGLWSGQPFSYHGAHYQIEPISFLPRPIQTPRIPIWIGGGWPRRGPLRRAARWDGFMPAKLNPDGSYSNLLVDDVRAVAADLAQQRDGAPFDLVLGGTTRNADSEHDRQLIRQMAEAGATWWVEFAEHPDNLARIKQGPLRAA